MSGVFERSINKKDYDKVSVIVSCIEEHGSITPKEAEKITKKSAATVCRYFKMLVGTKYVAAEGNTNNIIYHVSGNFI